MPWHSQLHHKCDSYFILLLNNCTSLKGQNYWPDVLGERNYHVTSASINKVIFQLILEKTSIIYRMNLWNEYVNQVVHFKLKPEKPPISPYCSYCGKILKELVHIVYIFKKIYVNCGVKGKNQKKTMAINVTSCLIYWIRLIYFPKSQTLV